MLNTMKTYIKHSDIAIPFDINRHANAATYDLYYGPYSVDFWREEGDDEKREDYCFADSCAKVSDWLNSLKFAPYMDVEGYPLSDEPGEDEGYEGYSVDIMNIREELFNKELIPYLA